MSPMRALRFLFATVVGFVLFQYVVLYLGGFLAAVQIPFAYFALFGRQHNELALALLYFVLHTVPTVVLITGGILATHRLWPTRDSSIWVPISIGMLGCLLLWDLVLMPVALEPVGIQGKGILHPLRPLFSFPWWAATTVASPWVGVGLGAWLLARIQRSRQHRGDEAHAE